MPLFKQECPICEFVFEIDEADIEESVAVRCACCDHLFLPSRTEQVSGKLPTRGLPQPRKKAPLDADQSVAIGKSDNLRSSIIVKRLRAKRRSNFVLLMLFLGAITSVAYLVYRFNDLEQQRQEQLSDLNFRPTEAIDSSDRAAMATLPAGPVAQQPRPWEEAAKPLTGGNDNLIPPSSVPTIPTQPPKYKFLSAATAADQAALIRPYLVLLEIESPAGTTYATGTIVDSRGYVATSLPAVAGATSIKVSPAQNTSQIKRNATPPLSDNVRSVLVVSRSQQWVLLEINRRLVLNANDISVPPTDRIVSLQPLLRVIAPQSTLDYVVSEMRVDSRKNTNELTIPQEELLDLADIKKDHNVNWILSPASPYDRLGAVLISPDGRLMAMLINSDDQFSYFVSAHEIARRLRENNFDKKPLSELSKLPKMKN